MFRFQPTRLARKPLARRQVAFRLLLVFAAAAVFAVPALTRSQDTPERDRPERLKPNQVAGFMRVKLDKAQKVLEGLTVENFEMIQKASHEMALMSQATNWQVLQTPQYLERSREFRRAANELTEAAERKNLEAAALAYVDVTLKCVECHKYVRRIRTEDSE